jgi:hypothetical protein
MMVFSTLIRMRRRLYTTTHMHLCETSQSMTVICLVEIISNNRLHVNFVVYIIQLLRLLDDLIKKLEVKTTSGPDDIPPAVWHSL